MSDLDRYAELLKSTIDEAGRRVANELEFRLHVEPVIRRILFELYGIDLEQIKSERKTAAGKFDTRYGGVIVEYEYRMTTETHRNQAARQALDYLGAERARLGDDAVLTAVVCDENQWGFLVSDEAIVGQLSLFSTVPSSPSGHFVWYKNSVAACRRFLELVGSNRKAPVSGAALVQALGQGSATARRLISLLVEAVINRTRDDKIDTLYLEWRRALDVAYGNLDDSEGDIVEAVIQEFQLTQTGTAGDFLFAIHTYFALVCRLIALEILSISTGDIFAQPSTWVALDDSELETRMTSLERGEFPRGNEISNLLEGDVFSWYVELLPGNIMLLNAIRDVLTELDRFAFPSIAFGASPAVDLLRELYQGLTPRRLRKALGEFLTPNWLAQATLEFVQECGQVDLRTARVLDPTCGTGTFLRPILTSRLQALRQKKGEHITAQDVQTVLDTVAGFDINPVAVVAARMNVLIALGELISIGDLRLPIWLADSVLVPDAPKRQGNLLASVSGNYLELVTSLDEPFPIPVEVVSQDGLARLTRLLETHVRYANVEAFLQDLEAELGPESPCPIVAGTAEWRNVTTVLTALYEYMSRLHREGRDEVWAHIIENRFAPVFVEKFDLVIGNPPWVSWTRLPEIWRRRAESVWRTYGLWEQPEEPGAPSPKSLPTSDIAALVTAVALERYLREEGILAFVVPKALVQADPGNRAFRQYHLRSREADVEAIARTVDVAFALLRVDDFSSVKPFSPDAANEPIVLIAQRDRQARFPIPGRRWFRRAAGLQIEPSSDWLRIKHETLTSERVIWIPVNPEFQPSPLAWWRENETPLAASPNFYTFGKGLDTRGANGIYFVELREPAPRAGQIRIANLPKEGRHPEVRRMGERLATVDADLIVPLVRGRDVRRFRAQPSGYILLPYDPSNRASVLDFDTLYTRYRSTYLFLNNFRQILLNRSPYMSFRPTERCWWSIYGMEHMVKEFLVCVTEIADPPQCAVVTRIWDETLGRTVVPVVDHKVTFYGTDNEAEAYYLCGMINSRVLQDFLDRYALLTSISPQTIRRLPLRRFDESDRVQQRIAEISRAAHLASRDQLEQLESELDEAVQVLLRIEK